MCSLVAALSRFLALLVFAVVATRVQVTLAMPPTASGEDGAGVLTKTLVNIWPQPTTAFLLRTEMKILELGKLRPLS